MRYYYIKRLITEELGTSKLGISSHNKGLIYNTEEFLVYDKPLKLIISALDKEDKFYFQKYQQADTYILLIIPELKSILKQFNMPEHRWYKAEAGYDLEFVKRMKKYFKIEYDIDLNEKRDYWVLQLLNKCKQELQFSNMVFNVVEFRNTKSVLRNFDIKINSVEEYYTYNRDIYLKSKETGLSEYIESPKYIYRKNYDILWGGVHIVFNEKVKKALEATNSITPENGLEFVEFTDYEIEMLGEDV